VERTALHNDFYQDSVNFTYITQDHSLPGSYLVVRGPAIFRTQDFKILNFFAGSIWQEGYKEGNSYAARFTTITGLLSLPFAPNTVWVADYYNHCLRKINANTRQTSVLTGKCGTLAVNDGAFSQAAVGYPIELIYYGSWEVWFFDNHYPGVRKCFQSNRVWRISSAYHSQAVNGMTLGINNEYLYTTHLRSASKIDIRGVRKVLFSSTLNGHNDDNFLKFKAGRFSNVHAIDDNFLLIVDTPNNVIRLVDQRMSQFYSICQPQITDNPTFLRGKVSECKLRQPQYLFYHKNTSTLYIAGKYEFYSLHVRG